MADLADDLRAILSAVPQAAPPSDAVREAALSEACPVCEVDRRRPCIDMTSGDPAAWTHPERARAAALANAAKGAKR